MRWDLDSSSGFTIVELLVTMGIVLIVLTAAYQSYTRLLRGYVTESTSVESQMAAVVNTNFLRLDIAHAGYGLAHGLGNSPIAWDNDTDPADKILTIRSMINNLKEESLGWVMCNNGTVIQNNNDASWEGYVFLAEDYTLNTPVDNSTAPNPSGANCPSSGTFLGYPYEIADTPSGCSGQPCYNITYELSPSNLDSCADGTWNLLRKVSGNEKPVLNCVWDWQVAFERDTSGDGTMDTFTTGDFAPSAEDADQIKQVHVYALVQEGSKERDYSFSGDTSMDGVNLDDPPASAEADHYRWKMRKISVKPQDL